MRFVDVDPGNYAHLKILYSLLEERKPWQNISHRKMPTWGEHNQFVCSKPYEAWYMVMVDADVIGTVYLTKAREIGIQLFIEHQRKGYGRKAVKLLMDRHPGRFLANINPLNSRSQQLFKNLGFSLIQYTYEYEK